MMMMIGQLNASHTGVSGGPADDSRPALQTRHPGFDLVADPSGFYKVGHIYKDGPADHDYLKIKEGDFVIAVDDHDLKTTDNYWQHFTLAAGSKFHFLVNDKPAKEGAWDGDDRAGGRRRLRRSAVRALGRRPPRDGHEAEQRRDRLPAHPRDGRAVAAPVPARSRGATARRRRSSSTSASTAAAASIRSCSASSPDASINTRSAATPASSSRGRRTSTGRWS